MAHQRDEGSSVGLQGLVAKGRQAIAGLAFLVEHGREAPGRQLDPFGRVLGAGVLPGGEPQDDEALAFLARFGDQRVDEAEIEAPLLWLDLLPGHGHQHGVGLEVPGRVPHRLEGAGVVAGVVGLGAEDQEGLAVDQQRMAAVARDEAGRLGGQGGLRREQAGQGRREKGSCLHQHSEKARRPGEPPGAANAQKE